jgi:hypothetical protein
MTLREFAATFAAREILPGRPGHEPNSVVEVKAISILRERLLRFAAETRTLEFDLEKEDTPS